MARKHLIHYHSSSTTLPLANASADSLKYGEIAVQHNAAKPELLIATVVAEGEGTGTLAHFIDSAATFVMITGQTSPLSTAIAELQEEVSALTAGSLTEILPTGDTTANYIKLSISAKGEGTTQTIGASAITHTVADAVASSADGLAVASDVRSHIDAINAKLGTGVTSANTATAQFTSVNNSISTINSQLSGFTTDPGSVKSYVDGKVTSVYRYKGTVAEYSDLPSSGQVVGDVWNVEQAHGSVPAGANYAWDGTSWDVLGGTIDTSVFQTHDEFNAWTGGTYTSEQGTQNTNITNLQTSATTLFGNVLYGVTSGTTSDYITVTIGSRDASTRTQSIGVSATTHAVASAVASSADGLAVASDVKAYVDAVNAKLGNGVTSANTVTAQLSAITADITGIKSDLSAVTETANGAVQSVSIDGTKLGGGTGGTQTVTATEDTSTHEVKIDFSEFVFDCGTY